MKWLLERMSEPSTYAGIGAILAPVASVASGTMAIEIALPAILSGLVAMFKSDRTAG